jgi:hypothetical protein
MGGKLRKRRDSDKSLQNFTGGSAIGKWLRLKHCISSAAEAVIENRAFIAAVSRCATQKPPPKAKT